MTKTTRAMLITTLASLVVFIPSSHKAPGPDSIGTHTKPVSAQQKLSEGVFPSASALQQIAPKPAPTSSGGCVTGYTSGDIYLDKIISYESGGNSCATNPGGCFGLLQACPGSPLRAACGGNPTCQIAWFKANKTGGRSWAEVWAHEQEFGWW